LQRKTFGLGDCCVGIFHTTLHGTLISATFILEEQKTYYAPETKDIVNNNSNNNIECMINIKRHNSQSQTWANNGTKMNKTETFLLKYLSASVQPAVPDGTCGMQGTSDQHDSPSTDTVQVDVKSHRLACKQSNRHSSSTFTSAPANTNVSAVKYNQ